MWYSYVAEDWYVLIDRNAHEGCKCPLGGISTAWIQCPLGAGLDLSQPSVLLMPRGLRYKIPYYYDTKVLTNGVYLIRVFSINIGKIAHKIRGFLALIS